MSKRATDFPRPGDLQIDRFLQDQLLVGLAATSRFGTLKLLKALILATYTKTCRYFSAVENLLDVISTDVPSLTGSLFRLAISHNGAMGRTFSS